MSMNKTFVILGAGSVGCYLGGKLLHAGHHVVFIGREAIRQELSENGLRLSDWQGNMDVVKPSAITLVTTPDVLKDADYVFVTVKSKDTQQAALLISEHCSERVVITSFQNGVNNSDTLKAVLNNHTIIEGMVPFNIAHKGLGQFHCGTEGDLSMGTADGAELALVEAFELAGMTVLLHEDMPSVMWGKLVMNLNNSINALSGISLLEQLHDRQYREVLALSINEALVVLSAANIHPKRTGKVVPRLAAVLLRLPNFIFTRIAQSMLKIDPQARSSMYEDLVKGRVTEIDYLNGEIIALGRIHGVETPINNNIYQLVKAAESSTNGSPMLSGESLLNNLSSG